MFKEIEIHKLSPNSISRLKKGHKVIIKEGKGMKIHIHSDKVHHIHKAFTKGKGHHLHLSPEEIEHNHGAGIFDKIKKGFQKVGHDIAPVAKKAGKVLLPIGKELANQGIDAAAKYAPEVLGSLGASTAVALGQPELAPVGYAIGSQLGKTAGKAGSKLAKKQVAGFNPYASHSNPSIAEINAYTGQNMGSRERAAYGKTASDLSLAELEGLVAQKKASMIPKFDTSGSSHTFSYADAVPISGMGLHKHHRHHYLNHLMGKTHVGGKLIGGNLNPSLESQPYSANYQWKHTLMLNK